MPDRLRRHEPPAESRLDAPLWRGGDAGIRSGRSRRTGCWPEQIPPGVPKTMQPARRARKRTRSFSVPEDRWGLKDRTLLFLYNKPAEKLTGDATSNDRRRGIKRAGHGHHEGCSYLRTGSAGSPEGREPSED